MKWFRHESRAHLDAKLQKVVMKYGFEGYGLYWYCVENICATLEPDLTFELEQDSEILAHVGRMDSRRVEEIMLYMVQMGLFEQSDNVVTCLKLARFLGESGTRDERLRAVIKQAKSGEVLDSLRLSQTISDCHSKIREDKRREEKHRGNSAPTKKKFVPPTVEQVAEYIREKGYTFDPEHFVAHHETRGWRLSGGQTMKCWKSACTTWQKNQGRFGSSERFGGQGDVMI